MKILHRLAVALLCAAALRPAPLLSQSAPLLERREVRVDGHPLTVWSKRPPTKARGAIVLLHGRTWSALPNFDLHTAGQRVSLMDALVARGYAVYALDARGYGATPRDSTGWLTPDRAERDASAVLDWVRAREGSGDVTRPALLGYSRGSQVALLVAQRHPDKLSAVVLYGFPQDLSKAVTVPPEPASPARQHTRAESAGEDFISPDSTPVGVRYAYVRSAIASDSVRVDWRHEEQFAALDPALVKTPVLLINGERDPYANAAGLPMFFSRLAGVDRWWVVLAHADHAAHLERQTAFVNAVAGFMERAAGR
jgi:pimeloyl-ACP methyl ester carboxylesterase